MGAEDVGMGPEGSGDYDVEVVLAGGPAGGADVGAGVDGVAADGGVDAPARQHTAVAVRDGEDPPGVVGVEDATGPAGKRRGMADTLKKGRRDGGVRYRDSSSLAEESTQQPLAGMLRTQGGDRL